MAIRTHNNEWVGQYTFKKQKDVNVACLNGHMIF